VEFAQEVDVGAEVAAAAALLGVVV